MLSSSDGEEEYSSNDRAEEWTDLFLKQFTKPILVKIDLSYINDSFNLFGLSEVVKEFPRALQRIKGRAKKCMPTDQTLYYMIHQRYILTKRGLDKIYENVKEEVYGRCQRYRCQRFPLLPIGISDSPMVSNTKLFCFQCKEIYEAAGELNLIDGCAFGRTFAGMFMILYKNHFKRKKELPRYTPRVFGFKIDLSNE